MIKTSLNKETPEFHIEPYENHEHKLTPKQKRAFAKYGFIHYQIQQTLKQQTTNLE